MTTVIPHKASEKGESSSVPQRLGQSSLPGGEKFPDPVKGLDPHLAVSFGRGKLLSRALPMRHVGGSEFLLPHRVL